MLWVPSILGILNISHHWDMYSDTTVWVKVKKSLILQLKYMMFVHVKIRVASKWTLNVPCRNQYKELLSLNRGLASKANTKNSQNHPWTPHKRHYLGDRNTKSTSNTDGICSYFETDCSFFSLNQMKWWVGLRSGAMLYEKYVSLNTKHSAEWDAHCMGSMRELSIKGRTADL